MTADELKKLTTDVVRRKTQDAAEFTKLARSIQPKSKEEK